MRRIAFVLAVSLFSSAAAAQGWQEYNSTNDAFTVVFPVSPQVEMTTYPLAGGKTVPARVYTARQEQGVFTVTVADIGSTGLDESAVIDSAVKNLSDAGEVKVNIPHRIYQVYGRQFSIAGKDGSRSTVAVFDVNGKLYQIEAKILPGGNDTDLIRFQQSLIFDRSMSNRSQDIVQQIKAACRGAPDAPNNPAGLDDPRCQQRR